MEKRKIDLNKYTDVHEEKTFKGKDGTEVTVRDHIAYADKEAMARELVEQSSIIYDESCIYIGSGLDKVKIYLVIKYYTDIDTDKANPNDVADYIINNDIYDDLMDFIEKDFGHVLDMYWNLYDALDKTYTDDKSLTKALRTSFSFLFNGEDITESLAKAEATRDTVYEAISALRKVEKEKEEKIDDGTLKIGGNVINFAKKE